MTAGRIRHWKHGWIPVSPEAKAYVKGDGPRPVTSGTSSRLMDEIKTNGGFTYNPRTGGLLQVGRDKGFAVAVPGTEEVVGEEKVGAEYMSREDFARGVATVLMKHRKEIAAGAVVGGWYSPERNQFMVELTNILPASDKAGAIRAGKERNQEAIFDLSTGETIVTGGTGDAKPDMLALSQFRAPPSPEEIAAAKFYTGPGYVPLNNTLRFGGKMSLPVQARMQALDAAIGKSVVGRDTTVYRGVDDGPWLPTQQPGALIEDRGYMSTATDPSGEYPGNTKMIIVVKAGSHALDLNGHQLSHHPDEKELLLPRGTKLRVLSDEKMPTGKRVIHAEAVA